MIIFILFASILLVAGNNIYLPFLPTISNYFDMHEFLIQLSISIGSLIASVIGIFYGRWSDIHGRRKMMLFAMVLYILGSLGCALSYDTYSFLGSRLMQDLGSVGINILAIAIASDIYQGLIYSRFLGTYNSIFSLICVLTPILGAQLSKYYGWHSNFWFLLAIALILIVQAFCYLPETLKKSKQSQNLSVLLKKIINMTKDSTFMLMTIGHIIPTCILLIFTVNIPFIFIDTYKFTPIQFSFYLSLLLLSNFLGNIAYRYKIQSNNLAEALEIGYKSLLLYIVCASLIFMGITPDNPYIIIAALCVAYFCTPYIITVCSTKAYETQMRDKALAVAVVSFWRNALMTITIILFSFSFDKKIYPVLKWTIVLSVLSFIISWISAKDDKYFIKN